MCSSFPRQAHGPEETHEQKHFATTYNLAMCHADGPRRVDTMLWSGITKVRYLFCPCPFAGNG